MVGMWIALAAQAAQASQAVQTPISVNAPVATNAPLNPQAQALFERDPMIKQWAVRTYDRNHDGWLTYYEAQAALVGFKELADGDRDGRVTTYEFDRAKDFIAAR